MSIVRKDLNLLSVQCPLAVQEAGSILRAFLPSQNDHVFTYLVTIRKQRATAAYIRAFKLNIHFGPRAVEMWVAKVCLGLKLN